MRHVFFSLLSFFVSSAFAQFSQPAEKTTGDGFNYQEIIVSVSVPDTACFLGCSKGEKVDLQGVLWLPTGSGFKPPYSVLVANHGAHAVNSSGSFNLNFRTQTEKGSLTVVMMRKGYAVLYALRKGFYADSRTKSSVSPEDYETNSCRADLAPGLKSAVSDVKAYLGVIATREDLNMKKIVVTGQSRGGVAALATAAEEFPGVIGVVNRSGMWMSETSVIPAGVPCPGNSQNFSFFKEFGEKIKVPVLSVYGTSDPLRSASGFKEMLSNLGKSAPSETVVVEGAGHNVQLNDEVVAKLEEFLKKIDP